MNNITDRVDINRVLMQMREMKEIAQGRPQNIQGIDGPAQAPNLISATEKTAKTEFSDLLKGAIDGVNQTQKKAGQLAYAYETGDKNVDITQVMIQIQKANVSFTAMTQVRNKLITAYQDIMNMPI